MLGESTSFHSSRSSVGLQVLSFVSWHFGMLFFGLNLILVTFKAVNYYYPKSYLSWDIVSYFIFAILESTRLMLLSKGNRTTQSGPLVLSFLLSLPLYVLHGYYIDLQTYVLRVDIVLNAIAFFFLFIETFFCLSMIVSLKAASSKF